MSNPIHTPYSSERSNWRTRAPSTVSTPLNASAPAFAASATSAQALGALSASGPVRVDITVEREDSAASPDHPLFLKHVRYNPVDTRIWYEEVLLYLSKCTFVIRSTADVAYSGRIFASEILPHIYNAVTKVELPKFYWFSGVNLNRHHNPYMQMCRNLPNMRELNLTFHTAGLTNQRWSERQIIALEQNNPEVAKERLLMSLSEVVKLYELDTICACGSLRLLRLSYIESEMTAYFCKVGNPLDLLQEIKTHLDRGFTQRGLEVVVELVRIGEDVSH